MRAVGLILAGGQSSRMAGGQKPLMNLAGRPLIAHALARLEGAVAAIAINANNGPRYASFGVPVIEDGLAGFQGPLAGVAAGLGWAGRSRADLLVTLPADTPFLPADIAPRLLLRAETARGGIAVARSAGLPHPVCAAWPVTLRDDLESHLHAGGSRKVMSYVGARPHHFVDFDDPDAFFNVNTPADLATAEARSNAP
ncbi:MAG: molybdenum cofactor guanylyltransferase MobA [Rhizobiaceae bacterium]